MLRPKLNSYVASEMPVQRLARAMRLEAENILENEDSASKVKIYGNKDIDSIAKEH